LEGSGDDERKKVDLETERPAIGGEKKRSLGRWDGEGFE
jgi:hypothetical protein